MSQITLDDIRSAADAKYGSYDIELPGGDVVSLLNPLRLHKDRRDELTALQKELTASSETDGPDVDQIDVFSRMIRCVAKSPSAADSLLSLVGDDLAVLAELVRGYGKSTQQGEASASAA